MAVEYVQTNVFKFSGATVIVHRPKLTEEEKKKRYERVEDALTAYAIRTKGFRDKEKLHETDKSRYASY